jgi:hypothetical protein
MHKRLHSWPILTAALLALTGCGGGDAGGNSEGAAPAGGQGASTIAASAEPLDACTFIPKAELETAIGAELKEGEPQSVPSAAESQCRFQRQLGIRATRSFPNPAIPASVGFTGITISTSPADPESVAEIRALDPGAFEDVPGLGDEAYYLGPNLLHVRKASRSFSIRIEPQAQSPDDQAKVREVMLGLARSGASRL